MSATKQEIIDALQSLDRTVDTNWTDDGSPRMDVLKAKLNDNDLTRKQINEALPGFNRKPDVTGDPVSQEAIEAYSLMAPPDDADTEDTPLADLAADLDLDDPTRERPLSREELRDLMKARIDASTDEITDCQKAIRDANAGLIKAQQRHSRLVNDYNRRFPPLSAAANIKQHLAAHQERKRLSVEEGLGISQVDRALAQTRKSGWNRPTRPSNPQAAAASA